jgi:hypothetical protein
LKVECQQLLQFRSETDNTDGPTESQLWPALLIRSKVADVNNYPPSLISIEGRDLFKIIINGANGR